MVWIDCEMTGLDPDRHELLEIATVITDFDLDIVARGPVFAIKQPKSKLKSIDPWSRRTHKKSGLLARAEADGVSVKKAEAETLRFVRGYCSSRSAPLCGNSIWQDKRFLLKHMPNLQKYLHYRIVDVSSLKLLLNQWYPGAMSPPIKRENHTALADIEESIQELRYYKTLLDSPRLSTE